MTSNQMSLQPADVRPADGRRHGWRRALTRLAGGSACAAIALAAVTAGPAHAAELPGKAGIVIASQATASAVADRPGGITVSDHGGQRVTLLATGQKARVITRPTGQPVTFTGLTLGKPYTVQVGNDVLGSIVPVTTPAASSRLIVSTTDRVGEVSLAWTQAARANTGTLSYRVTAAAPGYPTLSSPIANGGVLSGLNVDARYTFTVTPSSTAGAGKPAVAAMSQSLRELGAVARTPDTPTPAADPTADADPVGTLQQSAPTRPSAPAQPADPPQPRIKIIMVCPDGYVDAGSTCTKTAPYSYSTLSYTYHPVTRTWTERVIDAAVPMGDTWQPGCADGWCVTAWHDETHSETIMVKDAAPAGYTDSGSCWSKKNAAPAGYTDDGTQWVTSTGKIAKEVPA